MGNPVIFTEDSRQPNSLDVVWGVSGNQSTVFPAGTTFFAANTQAGDIIIPSGKVAILKAVMWYDSPFIFMASDQAMGMLLAVNGQVRMSLQRQIPAGGAISVTQLNVGFLQGEWLPTFLRLDENDILSLVCIPAAGVVPTLIRFKAQMVFADNTGTPINMEFTNS